MNEHDLTQAYIQCAVTAVWFVCVIVCFLKGKKWTAIAGIIATILSGIPIAGTYWHRIITDPIAVVGPIVAAIRIGYPDSIWSRLFYRRNPIKMLRAVDRSKPQIEPEIHRAVTKITQS